MRALTNLLKACITVLLLGAMIISGCGGGGTSSSSGGGDPLPTKMLRWVPPLTYTDSSPLNPVTDLDTIEIYVKENGPFSDSDVPLAYVSAVDDATQQATTSFNLGNLSPFLSKGVSYQVSLRAVAISGMKSTFSSPASFSF